MLSKLAVRRLTKLADFLDGLPGMASEHFDMSSWVQHNHSESDVLGEHGIRSGADIKPKVLLECGMKACALGWGCNIPSFRRAGLLWGRRKSMWTGKYSFVPVFGRAKNMDAAQRFFDLSEDDTNYLFRDIDANTPKAWADGCRKFIRKNA